MRKELLTAALNNIVLLQLAGETSTWEKALAGKRSSGEP
jgi:hypothetical protein